MLPPFSEHSRRQGRVDRATQIQTAFLLPEALPPAALSVFRSTHLVLVCHVVYRLGPVLLYPRLQPSRRRCGLVPSSPHDNIAVRHLVVSWRPLLAGSNCTSDQMEGNSDSSSLICSTFITPGAPPPLVLHSKSSENWTLNTEGGRVPPSNKHFFWAPFLRAPAAAQQPYYSVPCTAHTLEQSSTRSRESWPCLEEGRGGVAPVQATLPAQYPR